MLLQKSAVFGNVNIGFCSFFFIFDRITWIFIYIALDMELRGPSLIFLGDFILRFAINGSFNKTKYYFADLRLQWKQKAT